MKKKTFLIIILIFFVFFQPLLANLVYADYDKSEIKISGRETYSEFSKINSGSAYLYRNNDSNKKGITVCVNAGHGTSGASNVYTQCHPDGTPKVTGGTTAAGSTEAVAVSSGMQFPNGTSEATATLNVALELKDILLKNGYNVLMIRENDDVQLDNIARTVLANEYADCHVSLHFDDTAGGAYYTKVPDVESYKNMEPVKSNWQNCDKLGDCLIQGIRDLGEFPINGNGSVEMDLTQTSYSTIPSMDIELGNSSIQLSNQTYKRLAEGVFNGISTFFNENPNLINGGNNNSNKKKESLLDIFFEPFLKGIFKVIDIFRAAIDVVQWLIDLFQTIPSGTWKDFTITYKYDELLSDGPEGSKNKYTMVSEGIKESNYSVPIDGVEEGFTKDTEIPVIPVDLYNFANGNVYLLDTNVLTNEKDKSPITKIVTNYMHVTVYISAALLIVMLIFHGINIVRTAITPKEKAEHKNKLYELGKALLLLVGSIVFMALCIYMIKFVFKQIQIGITDELPVRVNVGGDVNYSFSTNGTGYIRYLTQITDTDLILFKFVYTIAYLFLVAFNLITMLVMTVRFIALMFLSIIGPLFAAFSMFGRKKFLNYDFKKWAIHYFAWSSIQLVLAILYRLGLTICIR